MKLSEYIEMLQHKLAELPQDPDVAFTQAGYYADGILAELEEDPQVRTIDIRLNWSDPHELKDFLVLGHSYQSY